MLDWSGAVPPSVFWRPEWPSTAGDEVIDLAASAGLLLDPWERLAIREMLGRTTSEPWADDSRWATPEAGCVACRQNGKDAIAEAISLGSLFLWGMSFVHSAHQFKTTKKAFTRLQGLILQSPHLRKRLLQPVRRRGITTGIGNEGIHLEDGTEGMFIARAGGSGRGFTVPVLILNEAWELTEDEVAAQSPAQATLRDPFTLYLSSAPDQTKHRNAEVLAGLRERARAGGDPDLCWQEWCADPDALPGEDKLPGASAAARRAAVARRHDEAAMLRGNPNLNVRIMPEFLHRQARGAMGGRAYDVEHLGLGDWPKQVGSMRWAVIREPVWRARAQAPVREEPPTVIAYAVAGSYPDAGMVSIARSWREDDGARVVEIADRREGAVWAVDVLVKLAWAEPEPVAIVMAAGGTAAAQLAAPLEAAGIDVVYATSREEAQAAGQFVAGIGGVDGEVPDTWHYGQAPLDSAVGGAVKHAVGDVWRWNRDATSDPVEAAGLARWGHVTRAHLADDTPWGSYG